MTSPTRSSPLLWASMLFTLAACAGLSPFPQTPSQSVRETYRLPLVEPIGKTVETLQRGGIAVSVSTLPFAPALKSAKHYKQLPTLVSLNDRQNYEETTIPTWTVEPRRLQFKIRVVNNLDDVVRLSGVLVRFNLDGKDYALDAESSGMKSLIDGVLAPQEQKEFDLITAPAETLRDGANFSLRIYAVPTGAAQKGNFEWNYRAAVREESREVQTSVKTVSLRPEEVAAFELAQARAAR